MTTFPTSFDDRFEDMVNKLQQRVAVLESQQALAAGAYAALSVTSSTHPASPVVGAQILETDTGLTAVWNGSAWMYPPQLIASVVLSGSQTSVTFSSIPQVFRDLRMVVAAKSSGTTAASYDSAILQFNGVTSGYNWNSVWAAFGGSANTASASSASGAQVMEVWNNLHTTAGRGLTEICIPNYATTGNYKGFTSVSGAGDGGTAGIVQTYTGTLNGGTAAVTSVTLTMNTGQFMAGSTFNVYGW